MATSISESPTMNKLFSVSRKSRWFLPALTAFFLFLVAVLFTMQEIASRRSNGNAHSFTSIGWFFASNNIVFADSPRPAPEETPAGVGTALDEPTSKAIHKLL